MRACSLSLSGEGLEFWGERSIFAVGLEKGGKDSVVRDFRTIAFDGKSYFLMNE